MTCDVCKVLKIKPDTFRQRIYREFYPEFPRVGGKRKYTLNNIKELIEITDGLIEKGILSAGKSCISILSKPGITSSDLQ